MTGQRTRSPVVTGQQRGILDAYGRAHKTDTREFERQLTSAQGKITLWRMKNRFSGFAYLFERTRLTYASDACLKFSMQRNAPCEMECYAIWVDEMHEGGTRPVSAGRYMHDMVCMIDGMIMHDA